MLYMWVTSSRLMYVQAVRIDVERRNAGIILVGRHEGIRPLVRNILSLEDNIRLKKDGRTLTRIDRLRNGVLN